MMLSTCFSSWNSSLSLSFCRVCYLLPLTWILTAMSLIFLWFPTLACSLFIAYFCFIEFISPCALLTSWNSSVYNSVLFFWCFLELFIRGPMVIVFCLIIFASREVFPRSLVKNTKCLMFPFESWHNSSFKPKAEGQTDVLHSGAL